MEQNSLYDNYSNQIKTLLELLASAMRIASSENDETSIENILEIEYILKSLEILLKSSDPLLISSDRKNSLLNSLEQTIPSIENYIEDSQVYNSNLETALSQANNITNLFPNLIPKPNDIGTEYLREAVVNSRRSATYHLNNISTDFDNKLSEINQMYSKRHNELEEKFNNAEIELKETYVEKLNTFENEVRDKQEEFNATLNEMLVEVKNLKQLSAETNNDIKSQKNRLDNAIAEFQKQFSERIGEYQKIFSEGEEERRKKLESSIQSREKAYKKETTERTISITEWQSKFTTSLEEDKANFTQDSQELMQKLRDFAQEAKVTVGLMSEKSLQNDYINQANREKNSARLWNLATFLNVLLLLVAIGYIFVHTIITPLPADQTSYPQILSKFLITAVIGVVARWTSRQANRHSAEERRLRRLSLELATINPFINSLPSEKQFAIKEILAMKYYGNLSDENAPFGEISSLHDADSGLKSIAESVVDKVRGKN